MSYEDLERDREIATLKALVKTDHIIIHSLVQCIAKHVKREHYPRFVVGYLGSALDEIVNYSEYDDGMSHVELSAKVRTLEAQMGVLISHLCPRTQLQGAQTEEPEKVSPKEEVVEESAAAETEEAAIEKVEEAPPTPQQTLPTRVPGRTGVDWDEQPLGKMADSHIAKSLGVGTTTVRAARIRRGIPAFSGKKEPRTPRKQKGRKPPVDWDRQPLDTEPPVDLARKLGVPVSTVEAAKAVRKKFGPGFTQPDGASDDKEEERSPTTSTSAQTASSSERAQIKTV